MEAEVEGKEGRKEGRKGREVKGRGKREGSGGEGSEVQKVHQD